MALTDEEIMQIQGALTPSVQLALPQRLEPIRKEESQVQSTWYDPNKLQALKLALTTGRSDLKPLKSAITSPRPVMSKWEAVANALAQYPESRSFTGGFGEEIINPWDIGLGSFARAFGSVYGSRLASEREAKAQAREDAIKAAELDYNAAEKAREDVIKAAQLENEASKEEIINKITDDVIKVNLDPNAKSLQEQEAATQKLAQTAYVKLNPNLPQDIRNNPAAFGYLAREADLGGRTPAGGTTGMLERAVASVAKSGVGDEVNATRGRILQEMAQYVGAVTDMARQGGATGQMMNSDKEGQRALAVMSNPSAYDAEQLASAAEVIVDLYDRMLAVKGMPSVREGYQVVSKMVDAQQPKQESDPWAKYRQ